MAKRTLPLLLIWARAKSSRFCIWARWLLGGSLTRGFASRLDAPFLPRLVRVILAWAVSGASVLMAPPVAAADNPAVVKPVETVTEAPPPPPSLWQPTVLAGLGARGNAGIGQPRQWYGVSIRAPALTKYSLVVDGGAASVRNSHSNPGPCETCEPTITHSTDTMPILRLGAGYTDGTMDAVVGLSKIGADLDGFARFTAFWGQRFVRIGIRDGSEVVVPQEFARVAVGSFLDAGEFPLDLSLALTVMRNGSALDPNFDLGVGGTWRGLRVVGHVSTNVITFALGYTPVVPPRFSPPLEPPPDPPKSALNEPDPATIVPAFNALAVTGRELTFVTKGLSAALRARDKTT